MKKRILKTLIILCTISTIIGVCFSIFERLPNKLQGSVTLLIEAGKSTIEIADILEENNIIRNKWFFILYVKTIASKKKLIAGEYEFKPSQTTKDIVNIISKGESITRKLTIPEGFTVMQIVNLLNAEKRLSGSITEIPAEGTLFPDTYYFKYGDLRNKLIRGMQEKMTEKINKYSLQINPNSEINNILRLITLASIVEKEAGNDSEKPIIASVFLNRLKRGIKLQADPTVIYSVTMGKEDLKRPISRSDLNFDSPYNTYKIKGLTPGPIACPGEKSIEAVLNPAKTNFLYFVVNGQGGHNFSSNLEEHNINVRNYREASKKIASEN